MNRAHIQNILPKPSGVTTVINALADNQDIINEIHASLPIAIKQVKGDVANSFRGRDVNATCYNIWKFLKKEIVYKKDGIEQKIKLPSRFIAEASGDCKSFSLFTASILSGLNIPYVIRYASYTPGVTTPQHVYVVTTGGIIIDAVWSGPFNTQKQYTSKKDYKMEVQRLSGFDTEIGATGKGKAVINKTGKAVVQGGKFVAKEARQAFLMLVGANIKGFSTMLSKADHGKIQAAWKKFGGSPSEIMAAIQKGVNKKATINGIGNARFVVKNINGIGAVAAVTTALAAAVPIIKEFGPLLVEGSKNMSKEGTPSLPTNNQEAKKFATDFLKKKAKAFIQNGAAKVKAKTETPAPSNDTKNDTPEDTKPDEKKPDKPKGMSNSVKVGLGIAAVVVAAKVLKVF